MIEHTPGPWFSLGSLVTDDTVIVSNEGKEVLGVSEWVRAEDADLRLMAAAPKMLEMLEEIALEIRRGQDIYEWYSEIADTIEKAKGEQG